MAKKTKKSAENIVAQPAPAAVATPTTTPKLIVAQRKFDRWYVYLKGVKPSENCGCGCKSAKSAIRYMHLVKARYGATISQNVYERLQFECQREQSASSLAAMPSAASNAGTEFEAQREG